MKYFVFVAVLISMIQLKFCEASDCNDLQQANEDLVSLVKDQAATIKRLRERLDEINAIDGGSSSTRKSISELRIITRDEWLAQSPKRELSNLSLPVKRVIIAHTGTENCDNQASLFICNLTVHSYQFHLRTRTL